MVQSKVLRPEWLPAVALSSALAGLMLLWSPQVGDLAAQVFRTELFEQAGPAIWNGRVVRRPLPPPLQRPLPAPGRAARAAAGRRHRRRLLLLPLRPPGPRPLGGRGALGDRLVRGRRRPPARPRPAHLRPRVRLRPLLAALPAGPAPGAGDPRRRSLRADQPGRRGVPRRRPP